MITEYHAKYYAHELSKRCPLDSLEKFTSTLMDAQVDLNPHQIDAALFAFKSPLSKGAILADEVGLGKTIEAGIVLSQKWAERRRKILIISPSSIRKQWNQELLEKFYLPSVILETSSFNEIKKNGCKNPFDTNNEIVICSYQFCKSKADFIKDVNWDLVVLDEAHRLRNVYKKSNKIARIIKDAIYDKKKLLLTATPLQNSLLELYGLVSFIDEHAFGDFASFKAKFSKINSDDKFNELKQRLAPICKRTLRRQVLQYIKYTNRIAIREEFVPNEDEQKLYDHVSHYLQRKNIYALPNSQRQLITLVLRKLLASSTFAIAGALDSIILRLKKTLDIKEPKVDLEDDVSDNFENVSEIAEEWDEDQAEEDTPFSEEDLKAVKEEIIELESFKSLAVSIMNNSKGEKLLDALSAGFSKMNEFGASPKALIFTESRRTQDYLLKLFEQTEHKGKVVLFNGSNNDEKSKNIYKAWLEKNKATDKVTGSKTAEMRAALVDYFKDEASIMIATEAAAEGVNLQFCSLVINYDLPWNPQRVEQRIGRCHRYGQKYDVVVINFINKNNAADQRVYQLLEEKFKLFSGVFGASDEVLGAIESGIDFEKKILKIYQECRTSEQIEIAFDELQQELEYEISEEVKRTKNQILEELDEEVQEKLKIQLKDSEELLDKHETWLWELAQYYLDPYANFSNSKNSFILKKNPFPKEKIELGEYRLGKGHEIYLMNKIPKESYYSPALTLINGKLSSFLWINGQFDEKEISNKCSVVDQIKQIFNNQLALLPKKNWDLIESNGGHKISDLQKITLNFRTSHPLAQKILEITSKKILPSAKIIFNYSGHPRKISSIEKLIGKWGHLSLDLLTIESINFYNFLIFSAISSDGENLDESDCKRLFAIHAEVHKETSFDFPFELNSVFEKRKSIIEDEWRKKNGNIFNEEIEKLEKWSDDLKLSQKQKFNNFENECKEMEHKYKQAIHTEERIQILKDKSDLEKKYVKLRRNFENEIIEIDQKKLKAISAIEEKIYIKTSENNLFKIEWHVR